MNKALETKEHILQVALDLTSKFGLESLSIGSLAKSVGMSKSGLFGHFKSKEKLQIMVMDYAAENFTKQVIIPAIKKPRGLPRLESMMRRWKLWSGSYMSGGCPILSSILEFDETRLIASSLIEFSISVFKISKFESIIFMPPCKILSSIIGLFKLVILV